MTNYVDLVGATSLKVEETMLVRNAHENLNLSPFSEINLKKR